MRLRRSTEESEGARLRLYSLSPCVQQQLAMQQPAAAAACDVVSSYQHGNVRRVPCRHCYDGPDHHYNCDYGLQYSVLFYTYVIILLCARCRQPWVITTATILPGSGRNSAICRRPTAPPPPQTRDWDHRAGPTRRRRCRTVSGNLLPFQSDCRAERSSPHSAARLRPLFAVLSP